jgi:hypothetical protein
LRRWNFFRRCWGILPLAKVSRQQRLCLLEGRQLGNLAVLLIFADRLEVREDLGELVDARDVAPIGR